MLRDAETQHLELIEPTGGGFFAGPAKMHHVGVWSRDVTADANALVREGWKLDAAAKSPEEGYGRAAFLRPPGGGALVELVTTELFPVLQGRVGPTLTGPRN